PCCRDLERGVRRVHEIARVTTHAGILWKRLQHLVDRRRTDETWKGNRNFRENRSRGGDIRGCRRGGQKRTKSKIFLVDRVGPESRRGAARQKMAGARRIRRPYCDRRAQLALDSQAPVLVVGRLGGEIP